jgi:hypothetical protein
MEQLSYEGQAGIEATPETERICSGAVPNILEAEIQRSIEGHTEGPQQLACSTGLVPVRLM